MLMFISVGFKLPRRLKGVSQISEHIVQGVPRQEEWEKKSLEHSLTQSPTAISCWRVTESDSDKVLWHTVIRDGETHIQPAILWLVNFLNRAAQWMHAIPCVHTVNNSRLQDLAIVCTSQCSHPRHCTQLSPRGQLLSQSRVQMDKWQD